MPRPTPEQRFETARQSLVATERGQEATMYGHLRDLFIEVLGYAPNAVDIDRRGARGRPDLTVFAPGAVPGEQVAWAVVEAKDERNACRPEARRAALFAEKSKYITADTAWFVMVDPTTLVLRPSDRGSNASADIVLDLATLTYPDFMDRCANLSAAVAGVPQLLHRFRDGDWSLIGTDRLTGTGDPLAEALARNAFFDGLEETTRRLQEATLAALVATRGRREDLLAKIGAFRRRFHKAEFDPYSVSIQGEPRGREEAIAHGIEVRRLNRLMSDAKALALLTLKSLPDFAERAGIEPEKSAEEAHKLERFFATETANLILARILLLRFLEDHRFFDDETDPATPVRRRYLCNGGLRAFREMQTYFNYRYTRLLRDAYEEGAKVYAAAFGATEHDWVLDLADDNLSRNVEWAMFRFARFEFTTVRGDILTGVYDRFLDARQRKAQGEFYTPPSIARYMLDRLQLGPEDRILDPACGSGTFLIERYQQAVGEDADRGLASYAEASAAVERIAGSDLNPFSAVLTQIQLLWHLLSLGPELRAHGIPTLLVAERANSLVPTDLRDRSTTRFGEIDLPGYAAVVGNPPYVRPERAQPLEPTARNYYAGNRTVDGVAHRGISPEANLYALFIYRALDHWCATPEGWLAEGEAEGEAPRPGRLAFVVPLSFCAADDAADLRRLFMPDGRWTITEIVDMELIWRHVFDADVLPMILFAEARQPREEDQVTIRHVDEGSVLLDPTDRKAPPAFDLTASPEARIAYADLFTPEGRIATRLTPERATLVRKLRALPPLADAAKRFWTKRQGGFAAVDVEPMGIGQARWEEQRLVRFGATRRGTGTEGSAGGLDVYKGENIRTGSLVGAPVFQGLDIANLSSPSVWRFPDILPDRMWCLPVIGQVPCAAPFDPKTMALLDTATVFGPRVDLVNFPFDLLLTSRIYGWVTLLSLRSSYQNKLRSHLYPTTIAKLPWSEGLIGVSAELEAQRTAFEGACRARYDAGADLAARAGALGLVPLRQAFRTLAAREDRLGFSDEFEDGEPVALVLQPAAEGEDELTVTISDAAHAVTLPNATLAGFARLGLELAEAQGQELTKPKIQALPVPADVATARELRALLDDLDPVAIEARVQTEVDGIDRIVGRGLGLTPEEVAFIQADMREDPFLSRVRPRFPHFTPAQRGRRTSLERATRYA